MKNKKRSLFAGLLLIIFMVTGCNFHLPWNKTANTDLKVYFLDVAQGNAVLVENQGHFMLIDGGNWDYSSFVVRYLRNRGVEKLDYIIASHYDTDHLNGIVGAINKFPCDLILSADYKADTLIYNSYRKMVKKKGVKEVHPKVGDTYTFGEAEFTVVCPDHYEFPKENDNSIGIRLTHGENSFLICGDAGFESEDAMLLRKENLKSDVYMASHHGSKSSSGEEFLLEVDPSYIVVSCGVSNPFGHPTKSFLKRAGETGAELLRTDLQGTLIALSDGKTIQWNKEPCNDWRSQKEIENGEQKEAHQKKQNLKKIRHYVLNTSSMKIHLPGCSAVGIMSDHNKKEVDNSIKKLQKEDYKLCNICKKEIFGED